MTFKILGQFVNPLTAHDNYSLLIRANLLQHFQIRFSKNKKFFFNFFFFFFTSWKIRFMLKHFQKKMTLIAQIFLKLRTPKILIRPFYKKHGNRPETLLKSERQHLYHIYWPMWMKFRLKKSLWVICKILGLFVIPLNGPGKYCLLKRGNLLQRIQMQLSQEKNFFAIFFAVSNIRFNFEDFQKKDDRHRWSIFELTELRKTWLDKCLKSAVSEDPWTSNMGNGPKNC